MKELKEIKTKIKTGDEKLIFKDKKLNYSILDFWRWSNSNILSNATRGKFAEFIVASALEINLQNSNDEWSAYDLETDNGIKIEVKTSAYIQSWSQKNFSRPTFSIKPAKYWSSKNGMTKSYKRHSDFYVFCLLKEKDQEKIDPLNLDQWEFYVVKTKILNKKFSNQKTISLGKIKKISNALLYNELSEKIYN